MESYPGHMSNWLVSNQMVMTKSNSYGTWARVHVGLILSNIIINRIIIVWIMIINDIQSISSPFI